MKTLINHYLKPPLRKWENVLSSIFYALWQWPHSGFSYGLQILKDRAHQALRIGRSAVLGHISNERHLVGDIFLGLGVWSIFFHQFFPEGDNDPTWYYANWFYFFYSIRLFTVLLFGSLAVMYYWPSKHKGLLIVFTVLHSVGWLGIIHYSFFVHDYISFHTFPAWDIVLMALSFGFGFSLSIDYLVYMWEHKRKGNHCRFVGVAEMDAPAELKERIAKDLAKEYRKLNTL